MAELFGVTVDYILTSHDAWEPPKDPEEPRQDLTYMVLICCFKRTKHLNYVVALFVLSLFVAFYLLFLQHNPWQIFLIAVLGEAIVFLSFHIQKRPRKGAGPKAAPAGDKSQTP